MEELQPQEETPREAPAEHGVTPDSAKAEVDEAKSGEPGPGSGSESAYTVKLDEFAGPLDLLLYLIQRDEVEIYDIPIAHITSQYLQYMDLLDIFDLDDAGEFLVMASTLMRIKARMLLPVQRPGEEDDDEGDPRDELVRRLLEYKKYKEAALELQQKENARAEWYGRGTSYQYADEVEDEPAELSLSLFDLLRAVRNVLEEMRGEGSHQVYTDVYTVEGQETAIIERLANEGRVRFEELFVGMNVKMEVVVTFVALLDLLKSQRIRANQSQAYGEIWLEAREPSPPEEIDQLGGDLHPDEVEATEDSQRKDPEDVA